MSRTKKATEFVMEAIDPASIKAEDRTPNHVVCAACKHSWVGFYTPIPVTDFGKIAKGMRCPMCAGKKIFLKLADQVVTR